MTNLEKVWHTCDEADEWADDEFYVCNIGFYYATNRDFLVLVGGFAYDNEIEGISNVLTVFKIPHACIKSIKRLKWRQ